MPFDLWKKSKDAGINISAISRRAIEHELYRDNPKFLEDKLRDKIKSRKHQDREIEQLREDIQKANNKQQERKERLQQFKPDEVKTYRKITPKGDK